MPKIPIIINADPSNYVEYTREQLLEYERRRYKKRNNGEEPTEKQLLEIINRKDMEMVMFGDEIISNCNEYDVERTDLDMIDVIRGNSRFAIKWIPAELRNYYAIIQPNKDDFAEEIVFNLDKYRKVRT
jgi:hypothetical protein